MYNMVKFYATLAGIILLAASYPLTVLSDVTINWPSTDDALSIQVLQRSNVVSDFTTLLARHFKSTEDYDLENLKVTIGNDRTPHIKTNTTELVLPYVYLAYAIKSHAELEETREAALDRAIDTVEYTLYHLFGHLIASDNSSDSDDIAEAVSSWLMIKGFTNGGEQWFKDAEAFGRASQLLDGPIEDYWHEHSLYKSRQRTINCWILGSDPVQYEGLLKPVLEPLERTQRCTKEWQTLDAQMQVLLNDTLQVDSSLRTNH